MSFRTFEPMYCPYCDDIVPLNMDVLMLGDDLPVPNPDGRRWGICLAGVRAGPGETLLASVRTAVTFSNRPIGD